MTAGTTYCDPNNAYMNGLADEGTYDMVIQI